MVPKTFGPYSPAKVVGDLVFVSGQVGVDHSGEVDPSIEGQTKQVIENLKSVVSRHSLGLESIVKTTIYLKNIDDFSVVNEIYAQYFDDSKPARATVEVSSLPKVSQTELLIEIEAIAHLGKQ